MRESAGASETVKKVGPQGRFSKVTLVEPNQHGYVLLVAEIDRRPPIGFVIESSAKKALIGKLKAGCKTLESQTGVTGAVTFKALAIPPGRGTYIDQRGDIKPARFDVAVLIETVSPAAARVLRAGKSILAMESDMRAVSRRVEVFTASNVRRIGPVDHVRDGVFLFNFFVAETLKENLGVWEYTAGWFQDQTGLDNSTVLLPDPGAETQATIINHCRWDHLRDIMPSILFKPTFRSYVLANFAANKTGAMPILYRLA